MLTDERRNEGTKDSFNSVGNCKHVKDRPCGGINPPLMDLRQKQGPFTRAGERKQATGRQ